VVAHFSHLPAVYACGDRRVFRSDSCWDAYKGERGPVFVVRGSIPNQDPYCVAELDRDLKRADVYYRPCYAGASPDNPVPNPLAYPLLHLMMVSLLPHSGGTLIHASGIVDRGRGLLFTGSSGTGKTTLARLWDGRGTVLNDERIALRHRDDRWRIYGTPWNGEYERFTAMGAPLDAIFLLEGRGDNSVRSLRPAVAVAQLASHCLLPMWDKEALTHTLEILTGLVADVPCYQLTCRPEPNVVDFLRCVK
jgi:hypothetical protein